MVIITYHLIVLNSNFYGRTLMRGLGKVRRPILYMPACNRQNVGSHWIFTTVSRPILCGLRYLIKANKFIRLYSIIIWKWKLRQCSKLHFSWSEKVPITNTFYYKTAKKSSINNSQNGWMTSFTRFILTDFRLYLTEILLNMMNVRKITSRDTRQLGITDWKKVAQDWRDTYSYLCSIFVQLLTIIVFKINFLIIALSMIFTKSTSKILIYKK